ncbi:translational GTPase TypA [Alphaproteobacteria bacterium]|jgi:GTP-binding protein|nr:translational GTPase TypA [Alphaproteobacteria bacterium]MDC0134900.1 translational GTPase TypA [Alphaproteobacteria bacterium]|tara:strand:- start:865 stop:2709 length:1845 start_codon:yes stop_codon:yes gene_type:complete
MSNNLTLADRIKLIRNIAIVAHVDHGKTTLVDMLLQQSGTFAAHSQTVERVMDSNDLEKERGITILSKNTGLKWKEYRINIVDTPGHADFGGEVERVLSMVDSVLLLVDAVDGPMPQTGFVTKKALQAGLRPIVVINKVDRDGARPDWVLDQTFDLFDRLGADEYQLDFPVVYASAIQGWATEDLANKTDNMDTIFETIINNVAYPKVDPDGDLQIQVSALSYSSYVGLIGTGRIRRGQVKKGQPVTIGSVDGTVRQGKVLQIMNFHGLDKQEVDEASAGDIVAISGLGELKISDTICEQGKLEILEKLSVDEPTISMVIQVNDSPFAGQEGKLVTSRSIRDRLQQELKTNVALRVEDTDNPDKFRISGRGELHLSILIENMRREGFEMGVASPEVITKVIDGIKQEPYESVTIDVEEIHQGKIMEKMGERKAQLSDMVPDGKGRVRLDYSMPSRGLIGFRAEFLTLTSGSGLLYHSFDKYGPIVQGLHTGRRNGALISIGQGKALPYALFNLQDRGKMIIEAGIDVYEGMIIGIHSRNNDLVVNPLKGKQLTNIRASGTDEAVSLTTPINVTLEFALEFINNDELVEVTPDSLRIRKRYLKEHERKKAARMAS